MWKEAEMADSTPDSDRSRGTSDSSRQHEDRREAVIRILQRMGKPFNQIIVGAGALSLCIVYQIMDDMLNIENIPPPLLCDTIRWEFPDQTSPPPAFEMPPTRNIIRINVYWVSSLTFNGSAVVIAMVGKQMIRDCRDILFPRQPPTHAQIPNFRGERILESILLGVMTRLYIVGLCLFFLGAVDRIIISVNLTVLALAVFCGLRWVFGAIRQTRVP